jgi:hypothetical protein
MVCSNRCFFQPSQWAAITKLLPTPLHTEGDQTNLRPNESATSRPPRPGNRGICNGCTSVQPRTSIKSSMEQKPVSSGTRSKNSALRTVTGRVPGVGASIRRSRYHMVDSIYGICEFPECGQSCLHPSRPQHPFFVVSLTTFTIQRTEISGMSPRNRT